MRDPKQYLCDKCYQCYEHCICTDKQQVLRKGHLGFCDTCGDCGE
jgi:hypothetical protein